MFNWNERKVNSAAKGSYIPDKSKTFDLTCDDFRYALATIQAKREGYWHCQIHQNDLIEAEIFTFAGTLDVAMKEVESNIKNTLKKHKWVLDILRSLAEKEDTHAITVTKPEKIQHRISCVCEKDHSLRLSTDSMPDYYCKCKESLLPGECVWSATYSNQLPNSEVRTCLLKIQLSQTKLFFGGEI